MADTFNIKMGGLRGPIGATSEPGGASGAVQYNNAGVLGGVTGITLTAGTLKSASFTGGTVTVATPMLTLAQTWNDAGIAFRAVDIDITNTASDYSSCFLRGRVGGADRFRITRDDMLAFGAESGTGAETMIGLRRIGGAANIGICVGRDVNTGKGADVVRFYFENGIGANGIADTSVAVMNAPLATNRLSIESGAAITHIANNGRYEWEGFVGDWIQFIAYQAASADGKPFMFNNHSQTAYADSVVQIGTDADAHAGLQIGRFNGSVFTPNWEVDGAGNMSVSGEVTGVRESIIIACGDEVTAIAAATGVVTFRMPYAFTLTGVRASLTTAQASGSIFTVDINEGGASILSTKLTIDNTEKTSTTAATPAVISDTALADDAEITIDVDQIGNGSAKGLKVTLIGKRP